MDDIESGTLYLVSTPIGNLEDITLRAIRILKTVDRIAAEDTRQTRRLLTHYDIQTPLTSYFEGNQQAKKGDKLISTSQGGCETIATRFRCGYPRRFLIRAIRSCKRVSLRIFQSCRFQGHQPCLLRQLSPGLPLHNFTFEGFLSPKSGKRKRQLAALANEERTLILFESPHRLCRFLEDVLEVIGERNIVIARELTKHFEEIFRAGVSVRR